MNSFTSDPFRHSLQSVSSAEIRAFRTSMSSRRFPALREMRDEDIAALVIANKKVQNKRLLGTKAGLTEVIRPSLPGDELQDHLNIPMDPSFFPPAPQGFFQERRRPPFIPINATQAKETISRTAPERFLHYQKPYEKAVTREEMASAEKPTPFVPNGTLIAKERISVNYYLNSPDEQTLALEKAYISERSSMNKQALLGSPYGRVKREGEGSVYDSIAPAEHFIEDLHLEPTKASWKEAEPAIAPLPAQPTAEPSREPPSHPADEPLAAPADENNENIQQKDEPPMDEPLAEPAAE